MERLQTIHSINNGSWEFDSETYQSNGESPFENITELYGGYTDGLAIPTSGNFFVGNPIEYQAMRIEVGEFYGDSVNSTLTITGNTYGSPQFANLVLADDSNPMYTFFQTINKTGSPDGM
jgi:hypothetical protein